MSSLPTTYITPEEYLERERRAEFKSEYYDGQIFAMSGASVRHARIVNSLSGLLWQQLEDGPCWVATNDLRLRVTPAGIYTYPDLLVICGEPQFADDQKDTVLNPVVLIEVLSKSTRDYDLGKKFRFYRTLPSLAEYLTVEQDMVRVERWSRQQENRWILEEFSNLGEIVPLPSIGCELPLARVYRKIELATE